MAPSYDDHGIYSEEVQELKNKLLALREDAVMMVKSADKRSKNMIVEQGRETVSKLKSTKAAGQGAASNILDWASSFVSDRFPLLTATVLFYVAAANSADSYWDLTECSAEYQLVRYALLIVSLIYLTGMGVKVSSAANWWDFVRDFYPNWIAYLFSVMLSMSLPPVSCYGSVYGETAIVVGAVGLISMAVIYHVVEWDGSLESAKRMLNNGIQRVNGYNAVEVESELSDERSANDV